MHELCELLLPSGGERNAIKLAHAIHAATDLELFYHASRLVSAIARDGDGTRSSDEWVTKMTIELGCPTKNAHVQGKLGRLCNIVLKDMMTGSL